VSGKINLRQLSAREREGDATVCYGECGRNTEGSARETDEPMMVFGYVILILVAKFSVENTRKHELRGLERLWGAQGSHERTVK
jgi:hypothetical protein